MGGKEEGLSMPHEPESIGVPDDDVSKSFCDPKKADLDSKKCSVSAGYLSGEARIEGDVSDVNVCSDVPFNPPDDHGFQDFISPSELRSLKKQQRNRNNASSGKSCELSAEELVHERRTLKNSFRGRLKGGGININKDITLETVKESKIGIDELMDLIKDIDVAIRNAPIGIEKPIQHLTVQDLEAKIKAANLKLSQLKSNKTKGTNCAIDIEAVSKETEAFVSHIQRQIIVTRSFQEMKSFQAELLNLKKICMDVVAMKKRLNEQSSLASLGKSHVDTAPTKLERQRKYALGVIREMKSVNCESITDDELTQCEITLVVTGDRFNHPYNYLKRIKNMFTVHIDKSNGLKGSTVLMVYGKRDDMEKCLSFLRELDFHRCARISISFTKYKQLFWGKFNDLSNFESEFKVLAFYYSGVLDILGPGRNVDCASAFIKKRLEALTEQDRAPGDGLTVPKNEKLGIPENSEMFKGQAQSTLTENESHKKQMSCTFLICKALATKFRRHVRAIETDYGVCISFEMSQKEPKGTLYINQDPILSTLKNHSAEEAVLLALEKLKEFVDNFDYLKVDYALSPEDLDYLFGDGAQPNKYVSPDTCMIRYNGFVYVVGFKNGLKLGAERVIALLRSKTVKPKEITVPKEEAVFLSNTILSSIEDCTGASIRVKITPSGRTLMIFGDDNQQEECIKRINDILRTHTSVSLRLLPAPYIVITDSRSKILKEIESEFGVQIIVSRDKDTVDIHGHEEKLNESLERLKAFENHFISLDDVGLDYAHPKPEEDFYASFSVDRKQMGTIIGKGGSTIKDLIARSGVYNVFVGRGSSAKETVVIHGNNNTVALALDLIGEILESDKITSGGHVLPSFKRISLLDEYSSKNSFLRKSKSGVNAKRIIKEEKIPSNGLLLDTHDEESFPTLG